MLGWPKRSKLAHAFRWKHSYKRLKLDQLLGHLGVFLTWPEGRVCTIGAGDPLHATRAVLGLVDGDCAPQQPLRERYVTLEPN